MIALLSKPFAITTSKNNLFNSTAKLLVILKLQETIPPKALIWSEDSAALKLLTLFLLIDTPQGFACLTITVPTPNGNDFDVLSAAYISL